MRLVRVEMRSEKEEKETRQMVRCDVLLRLNPNNVTL